MEREENEHRKDLTPSEKVELARKIEEELAGRHGSNQYKRKEEVQNFVPPQTQEEVNTIPQGKSSDIAAQAVDWNKETYRQAKTVVESGDEEVIQEMDSGNDLWRLAYRDNDQDGHHCKVNPVDVWADYAEKYESGMTQQEIADALGIDQSYVSLRLRLYKLPEKIKSFMTQELLSEKHLREITQLLPGSYFNKWLEKEQLWLELAEKAAKQKLPVKKTRELVQEKKQLIQYN